MFEPHGLLAYDADGETHDVLGIRTAVDAATVPLDTVAAAIEFRPAPDWEEASLVRLAAMDAAQPFIGLPDVGADENVTLRLRQIPTGVSFRVGDRAVDTSTILSPSDFAALAAVAADGASGSLGWLSIEVAVTGDGRTTGPARFVRDLQIIVGDGDDDLRTTSRMHTLGGGAGNDTLTSDQAFDTLEGGAGNDTFFIGSGYGQRVDGGDDDPERRTMRAASATPWCSTVRSTGSPSGATATPPSQSTRSARRSCA